MVRTDGCEVSFDSIRFAIMGGEKWGKIVVPKIDRSIDRANGTRVK